jgi:cell division protein FtsB
LIGSEDPRLHTLAQVTAALNTDLEGVTSELEQTHDELKDTYARIAQLEVERDGTEPPV